MKDRILIGVDFGGTKILTGAMSEKGDILCEPVKVPTNGNDEPVKIIKSITDSIELIFQRIGSSISDVIGIGMGVTGPLDMKNGTILECPQLPTLHFFPLRQTIHDYFALPVYMNNDANCLIYGETLFGCGVGKNNVVGFTLGTGIGCAIIIDRKILNGFTESAGEIWLSPYRTGTIEDFVSGAGVSKIYKEICGQTQSAELSEKTALEIALMAENGDPEALLTWEEFGKHLAVAISWSINLIDPEIIILGGSITNAFKFFSSSLEKNLRKQICPTPAEKTKIELAELGANAGFIGAASLAL
ncbi:MAG: ROK family protein [Ignavibacteriaceae bacterium]